MSKTFAPLPKQDNKPGGFGPPALFILNNRKNIMDNQKVERLLDAAERVKEEITYNLRHRTVESLLQLGKLEYILEEIKKETGIKD